MSTSGGLTSTPLRQGVNFNWVFLIELIVCGIVALFFLFYFNRVFATLVSYGLRAWTWHKYRVYIDIQSLQISLLAGRVFFRGVKYHGNNETILIHSGYITWAYWLRTVRELALGENQNLGPKTAPTGSNQNGSGQTADIGGAENGGVAESKPLPCRLQATLKGVEWFIYNRSAAYDTVLAGLLREDCGTTQPVGQSERQFENSDAKLRKRGGRGEPDTEVSKDSEPASPWTEKDNFDIHGGGNKLQESSTTSQTGDDEWRNQSYTSSDDAFLLRFLPLHIQCTKAAVVMGNEHTKSVLIAKLETASGEVDATKSTGLDLYRQLFNFQFEHPVIQMKPNDDYKGDQASTVSRMKTGEVDRINVTGAYFHTHSFLRRQRRRLWHRLQDIVPAFRSSVESFSSSSNEPGGVASQHGPAGNNWQGLSRYLDDNEQDDRARWSSIEYATVSTIADCSSASMCFYWDVAGTVVDGPRLNKTREKQETNINGDIPPEWGIKLLFKNSSINYGPWADRQRAEIQRVFFPGLCKDVIPSRNLVPGQFRVPTEFKLYIEFEGETTLRVPIREESKNWKWAKQADTMGTKPNEGKIDIKNSRKRKVDKGTPSPGVRPFGWIDIKIGTNATVSYVMDMVASSSGYSNKLELDLPSTEITTSVNHGLLWRSVDNHIVCDLSNPLQWNAHRAWKFDINSTGLELFILREHVFLMIDLVDDWATGPPPEYLTFTPFQYLVNLHLGDFKIYLNVNDANIVNNPSDFDDNTYIIIFGSVLDADICIPLEAYRPHRNEIPINIIASNGGLNLHVPPWNTQATFLRSTEIATLKDLAIDGKYQYCATTSTGNTDTFSLNVHAQTLSAQLYGFVIRYYLKVKDNYFGDDIRFKTLDEYQDLLRMKNTNADDTVSQKPPPKKSNDLDVILTVQVDDSTLILPSNLYSAKSHTRIEVSNIAVDLRFTNYYMDLDVVLSTLALSSGNEDEGNMTPISATSSTQLFIDGLTVSGNRLFGLPPTEPTYVCNWDFGVGAINGECTMDFFACLTSGARALGFSFDDDENALPSIAEVVLHDVTFLRAAVESIRVWLHVDEAAFLFSTEAISIGFNDWAGSHYSKKLNLCVPNLQLACVDAESASRHRSRTHHPVETHAFVQTTISFSMIQRKLEFEKDRQLQQEHVKRHDQRTHRADFLLHHHLLDDSMLVHVDPPSQCVPALPSTVSAAHLELESIRSKRSFLSHDMRSLGRKSSFLSISTSSQSDASIIRPQSSMRKRELQSADSRSRSLQTSAGPGRRIPLRDISASTGRQSSFYSAVGEHRGLPPSSVTFSSPYIAPYFPLDAVEPDPSDLPELSIDQDIGKERESELGLVDVPLDIVDEKSTHISFILEFPNGVRGVFDPQAAHAVAGLLSGIQAVNPEELLDVLQIDCMNEIFDLKKQKLPKGQVMDFSVHAPAINLRFLNSSTPSDTENASQTMHDQYDVFMTGISVTLRRETAAVPIEPSEGVRGSSSAHVWLASAGFSAKERYSDMENPQAAINGILEDVVFWFMSGQETSSNLTFRGLEVATSSNKIEYLASLIHRTELLGSDLTETFSSRLKQQRNRLQLFTLLVATAGQQVADPLFLTRPSYVLRSATDHLRTSDSWKIVTRLHHMFVSLDPTIQRDIARRCLSNTEAVPLDSQQRVHASLAQWRSWDLNNLTGCLVMAKVYGVPPKVPIPVDQPGPFKIAFRTENLRLVLDPGPKENEILFSGIAAAVEMKKLASTADIEPQSTVQDVLNITIELFCNNASVNLNWDLLELAEDMIKLVQNSKSQPDSLTQHIPPASSSPTLGPRREVHFLLATNKVSVTLDTINVRATSLSQGLNASFVMVNHATKESQNTISFMIAAEAATSKIKTRSQELSLFQLRYPSIYASQETQTANHTLVSALKIAGNCRELSFVVQQDILALIEVFDTIVGDELAQLHRLQKAIPESKKTSSPERASSPPGPKVTTRINIALFLDRYHISVPLLQSLTYNVSGVVARASVAAQLGSEIVFDFDIKEHSHDIQTGMANRFKSISLLSMPPTNGRVTISMSEEENVLAIFASVEPIELDAAAVHSLLTALNRPEISSVVADIREDLGGVQYHIEEIFGHTQGTSTITPARHTPLIYEAHLTLAGFNIFANAQGATKGRKTARLDFNLGCVELLVANRPENPGPIYQFPQLRMRLRRITFELSRLNENVMEPCGNLSFGALLTASSKLNSDGDEVKSFHLKSDSLEINLFADTASSVVDVMGYLQEKIRDIDLSREKQYLRKLRKTKPHISINDEQDGLDGSTSSSTLMFGSTFSLELLNIQVSWLVGTYEPNYDSVSEKENLVLSLERINLSTRKENSARLAIENLQLQMVPSSQNKSRRSFNSALLPEVIFNVGYVSTADARRLAFQAGGKSLDLRLTSQFMKGATELQKSIGSAAEKVRVASESWTSKTPGPPTESSRRQPFFGKKRMESLLVDADFAGAVVFFSGKQFAQSSHVSPGAPGTKSPQAGKYGQFTNSDANSHIVLRAPGLAWKVEYKDNGLDDPSLNAEVKVDASSNILYPSVVPLIMEVSATLKEIVSDEDDSAKFSQPKASSQKFMSADEDNLLTADPSAVLGRTRLNLGLRICRQEFTLSCQPIARVAATARFDDIYMTINTVRSSEHGHFFAASAAFTRLQASVQHVYSRESTGSFDVDSVFLSLMNSKHLSGISGLSAILKISPMKVLVNAKQLQDFLLFREIWVPVEVRRPSSQVPAPSTLQPQTFLVQRYQQVAATGAFPWNATVSIAELDVRIDLGQAIGKSTFMISNFWISSKKNSDWEQNLCLGFDKVGVDSTGRMSGFVALQDFKMRTSIQWPAREMALNQTPLVQGSVGFSQLRVKAAFDYQAFLIADITSLKFIMYNVRHGASAKGDRLVAILDGEAVQVFCTTSSASQALALYQAFQKLVQEKRSNYEASLDEIEKFMNRKSAATASSPLPKHPLNTVQEDKIANSPISLHTDVIVTLKAVNMGAFPNTFSDHQVFKLEALDAQARFAVTMDKGKIHSILGLTLGQLRIGLAGVKRMDFPRSVGDLSVEDVVSSATGSRGGTILKVPKVEATMQTWQVPSSNHIDYIFKSSFEGKVEVGWNYSRISYIRGMWASHSKALAQKLGKPLPPSAVKITGVPGDDDNDRKDGEQQKITAEVNMPQSKYNYNALEPPIIETPQLRDMGEATPPLEWIGLHRDRLPNLTHQIVIVTLLELASEVEDAYAKILGSS